MDNDDLPIKHDDPQAALAHIRQRLKAAARDYSAGKLSGVQFHAIYRHYTEKRAIIERILERNPDSEAWKPAAAAGQTLFLRERFEARPLYYVVFRKDEKRPLLSDGKIPKKIAEQMYRILQYIWTHKRWNRGLARKSVGDGNWMMLVIGDHSMTIMVYFLQPSTLQVNNLRDLHDDFERANQKALTRGHPAERMVFPQRALLDHSDT